MDLLQGVGRCLHSLHRLEIEVRRFERVNLLFQLQTLSVEPLHLCLALLLSAKRLGRGWSTPRLVSERGRVLRAAHRLCLRQR